MGLENDDTQESQLDSIFAVFACSVVHTKVKYPGTTTRC